VPDTSAGGFFLSKLLISEQPLQVLPSLAVAIGLNDALFLQQLHYWLSRSKHEHDGKVWIYNTYDEWKEQFPFWSLDTMQRIAKRLVEKELIYVHRFNEANWDRTNWYAINYDKLDELMAAIESRRLRPIKSRRLRSSKPSESGPLESRKLRPSYTETTTEKEPTETTTREAPFHGDRFLTALADFEQLRKEKRDPLKPTGRKALYRKFEVWGEEASTAALIESTANGWKGVFPLRNGNGHKVEGLDAVREVLAEMEREGHA
jgi:hypothetical protein